MSDKLKVATVKKNLDSTNIFSCSICERVVIGQYGNNAWPINDNGKCCDDCNAFVIVARIYQLQESNRKDKR